MVRTEINLNGHQQRVQLSKYENADAGRDGVWTRDLPVEGELPKSGGHVQATARLIWEALCG